MKRMSLFAGSAFTLAVVLLASVIAGCDSPTDEGTKEPVASDEGELGPGAGGTPRPGFREKDTSPVVERGVENNPNAKIRLLRRAEGRREPHYVGAGGVDIVLSFVPHATRWVVSGAAKYIASEAKTIVCLTTSNTLGVATAKDSIQTTCAVIDNGAKTFHDVTQTGTWTRGITDQGAILFTRDPDPFRPVRYDDLGKGCDATSLQKGHLVFVGASYCAANAQPGAECEDICFKTKGHMTAEGFCQVPADAVPFCSNGQKCTGDKDPAKRCK